MDYRIVEDKTAGLILEAEEPYALLATFFATDVQQDPELCQYYLKRINKVLDGKSFQTDLTGNAHTVMVTPVTTTITSLFNDTAKPVEINTLLIKKILERWVERLLNDSNNQGNNIK